ncbi:Efflux RND transporter periplasmic adaptor subunit [Candidatus Nitrotoga sp. HW29]|uniref:efflux RND transporter periplasmic adaptor subunit n=1 Tax=Candidatus Nitrotoga sp. HW29 TaxID=2886963 RepID=UPI001EF34442|nr:efflux RND transporter periplasmic adaptor subunit [Candidatus Nitrotoga sp. HW29]CAH1906152.1 Efflux RND transporter periplasmic adaptor subunit [Candidatus Nitrotoga sp. HW29]
MIKLNKKFLLFFFVITLVIVAGYWGWNKFSAPSVAPSPEKSAVQATSDQLRFAANAPQLSFLKIKTVEAFPEPLVEPLNGRIVYNDNHTARVFSPLIGRVVKIPAEVGMQIKKGDQLLVLDSPDFAMAIADNVKADADLLRKQEIYERTKQLYQVKGIARKEVEAAVADWQQAQAESRRTKARIKNLNADVPTSAGQFILRAPIDGIISERQVNAGSEVRSDAANPLFVITDPLHLWVQIDLPERQLDKVSLGDLVSVEVDAYPGETFQGKVTVIGGTVDPFTRRIQVRCELDNPHLKLKPEMFARVIPIVNGKSKLPRVPNASIVTQGLFSYLFVEQSPGVLQRRRVTLSLQGSEYAYVKEGLQAGERVVTSGALLLNSELGIASDTAHN